MTLKIIVNFRFTQTYRVAEVVRRYEGSSTKSSYLYENCRDIKICCELPPNMAKYAKYAYLGAYLGARNMVKWGVPENILQNAVQTRWS